MGCLSASEQAGGSHRRLARVNENEAEPSFLMQIGHGLRRGGEQAGLWLRASAGEWHSVAVERHNGGQVLSGSPILTAEQCDENHRQRGDEE